MAEKHRRTIAQDKCLPFVAQAMREGWGCVKLAEVSGVDKRVASDMLAKAAESLAVQSKEELGVLVSEMRVLALNERPAVVKRLRDVGEVCDALVNKARALIESLPDEQPEDQEDDEGNTRPAVPLESRLAMLAGVVQKAAAASAQSWACFKDASGLGLAERVREAELVTKAKAKGEESNENAIDVEVVFPD